VKLLVAYIKANWVFALFIFYMVFSCMLKIFTGINITIPCLFTTFFGFHCPGCGLTSAFIELLQFNPAAAWDHNPLIFVVIPGALAILFASIKKFSKRNASLSYLN
jgi:hypothetical protein